MISKIQAPIRKAIPNDGGGALVSADFDWTLWFDRNDRNSRWTEAFQRCGVVMTHGIDGSWQVFDSEGRPLDIAGSTTEGLQEAIDYAYLYKYPLWVYGAGIKHDLSLDPCRITCSTPITFHAGERQSINMFGINLLYTGNPALDFLIFETMDVSEFNLDIQVIYTGTASAVRVLPTATLNTSGFIGLTSSNIHIHSIICVDSVTLQPDITRGTGFRISSTDYPVIAMTITIDEFQGGLTQFKVDNPTSAVATGVEQNRITLSQNHNMGTAALVIGTSGTNAGRLTGNIWMLICNTVNAATIAISTFGNKDTFIASIESAGTGVSLGSSASANTFLMSRNDSATPWTDGSTAKNNIRLDAQAGIFGLSPVAFADLPAAPVAGMEVRVTNSTTAVWGAVIAGGGANDVGARYNGANWTVYAK